MPMVRCESAAGRFPTPRVPRTNMGDLYHIDADGIVTLSVMRELDLLPALFTLSPDRSLAAKDITAGGTLFDLKLLIQKERL